jgi:hypothetical protein
LIHFNNNEFDEIPFKLDSTEYARSFRTNPNPALMEVDKQLTGATNFAWHGVSKGGNNITLAITFAILWKRLGLVKGSVRIEWQRWGLATGLDKSLCQPLSCGIGLPWKNCSISDHEWSGEGLQHLLGATVRAVSASQFRLFFFKIVRIRHCAAAFLSPKYSGTQNIAETR